MECCGKCDKLKEKEYFHEKVKGGKKKLEIKRNTLIWVVIGVLFVATLYLTFRAGASPSVATSATQAATTAAKSAASSASYGGMVGGC